MASGLRPVAATVQANYRIAPEQRDWVVQRASQLGITTGEFIEMLIVNWRQYEAGKVTWQVVRPALPAEQQDPASNLPVNC